MRALSKLRDGLVGAWCPSVGGWGGNMLRDLSGYGNHGTLTNMDPATDWVVSEGKQALDFDGVDDYIPFAANMTVNPGATITAWFNPGVAVTAGRVVHIGDTNCNIQVSLGGAASVVINNVFASIGTCTVGLLYHAALVWEPSGNYYGFLNAVQGVSGTPFSSTISGASGIGNRTTLNRQFVGTVFDVRIYNRVFSTQEIRDLYNGGPGYGLRPERTRRLFQGPTFNAARLRRQSLIGSGVY